jgi:hypothetical protein
MGQTAPYPVAARPMTGSLVTLDLTTLDVAVLRAMAAAGAEVLECHRAVANGGGNIVAEILPEDAPFYEFDHCPPGDIFDPESHAQFYYHAHRPDEHGHFHTFLREAGMAPGTKAVAQSNADYMSERNDKLSHLIAISMDQQGFPIGLFTANRWVTAENWYKAADVCAMLDRFEIDHARPSWPTNRWITAMLRLFRPQIGILLHERDTIIATWRHQNPSDDVFEDRRLEITSELAIRVDDQIKAIDDALGARH